MKRGFLCSATVFALSVIIITAALFSSFYLVSGAEFSNPTMFVNDEPWYNEAIYPWKLIDGQCYVPTSFLSGLNNVTTFYYPQSNSVIITYNDNYISIDILNFENAYSENIGVFKMKSMFMGPEDNLQMLYVPIETVCRVFGIYFETNSQMSAIRIYDSSATKTFDELIAEYNPVIDNQDTTQNIPGPFVPNDLQYVYLTFEDAPGSYMDEIVDLLDSYGYKATFFLNGDEMIDNADTVRKAIASGHAIGLHSMTQDETIFNDDNSSFIYELDQQNDLLYRIFKIKTRLVRAPEGSDSRNFRISNDLEAQIYSHGYSLIDWDHDTRDLTVSAATAAANAFNEIEDNESTVVRFHCEEKSFSALKYLINQIKRESNIRLMALPGLITE